MLNTELNVKGDEIEASLNRQCTLGYVTKSATGTLALTASGKTARNRLITARYKDSASCWRVGSRQSTANVQTLLQQLATALVEELPHPPKQGLLA